MTKADSVKVAPLNPVLHGLLERKFGSVRIANQGLPARFETFIDPITRRTVRRSVGSGEYYAICCPFCDDCNHKLWVNYLYGQTYNPKTGRRADTYLACCYKNQCLREPGRLEQFEDLVFGAGRPLVKTVPLRHVDASVLPVSAEPPGEIVSLADLPPEHAAVQYVRQRGYDPAELARDFSVGVCVEPAERYSLMRDRLYIPVTVNGKLAGWQGRATVENRSPKYYNMPGMQKSRVLYNYEAAARAPFVVVVEGVPSVWRIGAPGVCIFGKTLSAWQANTIATTWAHRPIFLMFDADAPDALEDAAAQLCRHGRQVVPVVLPDRDPADYSRAQLRQLLANAAAQVDVPVDLSNFGGL